jgi:hypothetical protein
MPGAPPRRAEPQRRGRFQPEPDEPDRDEPQHRTGQQPAVAPRTTKRPLDAEPPPTAASAKPTPPPAKPDDEFDDYDERVDDEDVDEESPAREWLVMTSQLAVGAVGGAALWLGFQWLWRFMPLAALGVALVVITALVWIVRRIRHSDDLQTTVVTVLVGLFVTVSPAALLLLGR